MNRRKAREYVLKKLFQFEFAGTNTTEMLPDDLPTSTELKGVSGFADEIFQGTIAHLGRIDEIIQEVAEHWKLDRMAAVDRNILRYAVYEILFRQDIPPAVTINEAIEIAKKYSSSESAAFINGLLDKVVRFSGKAR